MKITRTQIQLIQDKLMMEAERGLQKFQVEFPKSDINTEETRMGYIREISEATSILRDNLTVDDNIFRLIVYRDHVSHGLNSYFTRVIEELLKL